VAPKPANTPISELDLTRRARPILAALGVTDSDQMHRLTEAQVEKAIGRAWGIWSEVCRVLASLGYDVSGRWYCP
jgi:hypothetical protein